MDRQSGESKAQVTRLSRALLVSALVLAFFAVGYAQSKTAKRASVWYTVGSNTESIRVRSYVDGKIVLDRSIDVVPGQVFRIDPE